MVRDALVILNKEMMNLAKDRRTLLMLFGLPLVLMPLIFGTLGFVAEKQEKDAAATVYALIVENNADPQFRTILSQYLQYRIGRSDEAEGLSVAFPEGYVPGQGAHVQISFDSRSSKSAFAARRIHEAIREYENVLADRKLKDLGVSLADIRNIAISTVDMAPVEAQGSPFLATLLPYMILIYVFAGSMNIGLDATAGEKERGSLASILVNQVSRTSIALGKIFYVISAGLVNSLSSFAGILIAIGVVGLPGGGNVNIGLFSFGNVIGLLLALVSISGVAASVIILIGSSAKNMKEGGAYVLPVYLLVLVIGVATMQMDATREIQFFFMPFVNGVFVLKEILTGELRLLHLVVMLAVNAVVVGVLAVLIARLFNSERILRTV